MTEYDGPRSEERTVGEGRGNFFAVDRRAFAEACKHGMNAAIVYLVLARGTGPDQRTTAWSVNAVEQRTGVSRPRAQTALDLLMRHKLVLRQRAGSRPAYYLTPVDTLPAYALSDAAKTLKEAVETGGGAHIASKAESAAAQQLIAAGWCCWLDEGRGMLGIASEGPSEPQWIWLPNSIIDGVAGETPPLERLRPSHDVRLVRLFVQLYDSQNLAANGGIHWQLIRVGYERERITERGRFVLWGFNRKSEETWRGNVIGSLFDWPTKKDEDVPFWTAWKMLRTSGLVECVPHLIEADTAEGEVIHPCPDWNEFGTDAEKELGSNMRDAARIMLGDTMQFAADGYDVVAPVADTVPNVALVGVYRLRYRPRTAMTGAWWAQQEEWTEMAARYVTLAQQAHAGQPLTTFPAGVATSRYIKADQR